MIHNTHFNHEFRAHGSDRVPTGSGDRYWAQDLARDFRYLEGKSAEALVKMFADTTPGTLLSGGVVTEGSDKARVNVTAAVGICLFEVEVADPSDAAIPTPVLGYDIRMLVKSLAATDHALGGTLNGVATNYLKLVYLAIDGPVERARAFEAGLYHYSKVDSYQLVSDAVAPTEHDVLLATYVGDGSTSLTITQVLPAVGSEATANAVMRRDSSGRAKVAAPSAADDVARLSTVTDHAGLTNPHSATAAATADRLMLRDAAGRSKVAEPAATDDVAVLKTVTDHAGLTSPHSATAAATADRLMLRDAAGRCAIASPSADGDAANKGWVRDFIYPVGCYYTQYPAASSNTESTEFPTAQRPATLFGGTWEEQWSTESVYFRTRGTLSDTDRSNGKQEDALQYHGHELDQLYIGGGSTSRYNPGTSGATDTKEKAVTMVTDGAHGAPRAAEETRVVNRRIKVWKRTA